MKVKQIGNKEFVEFGSLIEFYEYIVNTPINETFQHRWKGIDSVNNDYKFTQTNTFDEAIELFKNGWQDMSEKLTQKLKVETGKMEEVMVSKNVISVQGYHPIVPLYLNGIPTNMVSRKMQPVKQKVITVNKDITYACYVSIEQIIEQSVKALTIIKKLENQNYRCNLNVILGTETREKSYIVKVKIKSANERLNVNKLSFPLVHPSMLRRLFFRFIETYPGVPSSFSSAYGHPIDIWKIREACKDEILLPKFINKDIKQINTLDDLEKF